MKANWTAVLFSFVLFGCGDTVERLPSEKPYESEVPSKTNQEIAYMYLSCIADGRDDDACELYCSSHESTYRCDKMEDNLEFFTDSPLYVEHFRNLHEHKQEATTYYLSHYAAFLNDDVAEEACAARYGHILCDEVEDTYESHTDPDKSTMSAVVSGAVIGAVLNDSVRDSRRNTSANNLYKGKSGVNNVPVVNQNNVAKTQIKVQDKKNAIDTKNWVNESGSVNQKTQVALSPNSKPKVSIKKVTVTKPKSVEQKKDNVASWISTPSKPKKQAKSKKPKKKK